MTSPGRARLLGPAMLGVASGAVLVPLNSTMLAVALPSVMPALPGMASCARR